MRVVLDANVVAPGVFWSGAPQEVLRRCLVGKDLLPVSLDILAECREVLRRLAGFANTELADRWDVLLMEVAEIVEPRRSGNICRDPDDEKYLEAAVGGRAHAIVSGDKDILVLKKVRGIPVFSPREFLSR